MYSCLVYTPVVAAIKGLDSYDFFTYDGPKLDIPYRNGKDVSITKGQKFGVRKSSNNKEIRLILNDDVSRVFTITLDLARKLARNVRSGG